MRRVTVFVAAVVAATAVAQASATEATIYPGVGIGHVKLGMTQTQVKKALGNWRYVNEHDGAHLSVGWGFAAWTVDFMNGRVVQVATALHAQRTKQKIGPGSTWRALVRAYPYGTCAWYGGAKSGPGPVEYLIQHKNTQTIYYLRYPQAASGEQTPPWTVTEVHVRTRFEVLPEFGQAWEPSCKSDWRTSDSPL
jgi:hypothetical protein